jgi:pimeloyl-ACP methyl ester carboxylesterase
MAPAYYYWNGMIRSDTVELFIPFRSTEARMIDPFTAKVPDAALADLQHRLAGTRWAPEQPAGAEDGAYGDPLSRVRRLAARWQEFDWRAWEARLNAYPQFITGIDGQPVHFLHARSAVGGALPVVLSHGWPGSVFEYIDLIGRLTDPAAHGADPADAFHVVLPSLPGYGFSGPALQPGWGTRRIAAAWAELMARLGYERYGAIGNDAGSMISPELGRQQPAHVAGVHVTQLFSFPGGDPAELVGLDADEQKAMSVLQWFWQQKGAFNVLQGQQPQTLAHALADSPAGLLGWNAQLFDESLDDDFVLANVTLYWLTGTAGTSIRHYYEDTHQPAEAPAAPTQVPVGLAAAADGDFRSIRRFASRDHANITSWTELPGVTGHYSAYTSPDELAEDIRRFFRPLRPAVSKES